MRRLFLMAFATAAVAMLASAAHAKPAFKLRKGVNLGKKSAQSKGPSHLKAHRLDIKRVSWPEVELVFGGLDTRGARVDEQITVWFVDGAHRHNLFRRKVKFTGQRGGFPTSFKVNLNRRAIHRGHLEVTIDSCKARAQCKKTLRLNGGDLVVDGRPAYRPMGTQKELQVKVKNAGPQTAVRCKALLQVNGRTVAEKPVGSLRRNARANVKFRYDARRYKNKDATVKLDCRDLAPSNNEKRLRLR